MKSNGSTSYENGEEVVDGSDDFVARLDEMSAVSIESSFATTYAAVKVAVVYASDHWKIVLFGQSLSFLLACGGAAQATLHFECSLSAPAFSSGLFYSLLSLHLIPLYLKGRHLRHSTPTKDDEENDPATHNQPRWFLRVIPVHAPFWGYAIVALMDVQANYVTVLSFRYTTLSSVSLFDSLAIPSAMVLSRFLLGRRHTRIHLIGVISCMVGVMYNAFSDYESDLVNVGEMYPQKLKGDVLALIGGLLYGASDVLAELAVRNFGGPTEFLGMMGFFATIISIIQAAILEREEIMSFFNGAPPDADGKVCAQSTGLLLLFAFMMANALNYTLTSWFLLVSEATFLNLSLLTGDLWSVIFMVVAEGIIPQPLFWAALTMIVSGVLIYEMGPNTLVDPSVQYEIADHYGSDFPETMSDIEIL